MPFLSFGMCWDFQLCQTQTPYAKTLRSWGYNFAAGSSCKTLQASLTSMLAFWVGKPVPHFVQAPLAENQPKLIPSKATARKPKPSCVHSWSNPCSQGHTNTSASPRDQPRDHHGAWSWPLHHGVSGVLQGTWVHGAVTEPLLGETEVTPGSGQPWLLWCQIKIVTEPKNARELFSTGKKLRERCFHWRIYLILVLCCYLMINNVLRASLTICHTVMGSAACELKKQAKRVS